MTSVPLWLRVAAVTLVVCCSGNMVLSHVDRRAVVYPLLLVALIGLGVWDRQPTALSAGLVVALALVHFLAQGIGLGIYSWVTFAGLVVRVSIGLMAARAIANYGPLLVRVLYAIGLLALAIHGGALLLDALGVPYLATLTPLADLFQPRAYDVQEKWNVGVHTFHAGDNSFRNSGMFWEPGALAGYMCIGLVLSSLYRASFARRELRRMRVVLLLALASTVSVTGYVAGLVCIALVRSERLRGAGGLVHVRWLLSSLGLSVLAMLAAAESEYLGLKVSDLYERAVSRSAGWELSRFGSALFDWLYIERRPWFGWGQSNETQFSLHPWLERFALGNGFTGFARQMGVPALLLFLFATHRALLKVGRSSLSATLGVSVVVLVMNGEYFLDYPLMLSLPFLLPSSLRRGDVQVGSIPGGGSGRHS